MTGWLSVIVRAEVAGEHLAEVLEVLHDDRPVVAGRVDALLQLVGGSRPPSAAVIGSPVRPHEEEDHRDEDEDGREDEQEPDERGSVRAIRRRPISFGGPEGWRRARGRATSVEVMRCLSSQRVGRPARASRPTIVLIASYLVSGANRNLNEASRTTPSMPVPETAT